MTSDVFLRHCTLGNVMLSCAQGKVDTTKSYLSLHPLKWVGKKNNIVWKLFVSSETEATD